LNKKSHSTKETFLLKTTSRQPKGLKPVRLVWETGQTGFAWTVGNNTARGKNSTFQAIDLPIRSTDQSEALGIVRVPRGLPLARSSVPQTHSIKRNRKSTLMCDMGTHGSPPTRVLDVPVKWTRPARSPVDPQVGPTTFSTVLATSEDHGRPYPDRGRPARLAGQVLP
jgi:hypothetical protein